MKSLFNKAAAFVIASVLVALTSVSAHAENGNYNNYEGSQAMSSSTVVEGVVEYVRKVNLDGRTGSTAGMVGSGVGALGGAAAGYKAGGGWGAAIGGAAGLFAGGLLGKAVDAPDHAQEIVVRMFPSQNLVAVVQSASNFVPGQPVMLLQDTTQDQWGRRTLGKIRVVQRGAIVSAAPAPVATTHPVNVPSSDITVMANQPAR